MAVMITLTIAWHAIRHVIWHTIWHTILVDVGGVGGDNDE